MNCPGCLYRADQQGGGDFFSRRTRCHGPRDFHYWGGIGVGAFEVNASEILTRVIIFCRAGKPMLIIYNVFHNNSGCSDGPCVFSLVILKCRCHESCPPSCGDEDDIYAENMSCRSQAEMQAEASLVAGRGEAVTWEMRERMPFTRSPSSYHHRCLHCHYSFRQHNNHHLGDDAILKDIDMIIAENRFRISCS